MKTVRPFGYLFETVHTKTGDVVQSAFTKLGSSDPVPSTKRMKMAIPGYHARITLLYTA